MNWHRVITSLHVQARDMLEVAQVKTNNGDLSSSQAILAAAHVLISLADALREGISHD